MTADNEILYKLWDHFLETWPVERVRTMSIAEYTRAGDKESFTRWIESNLDQVDNIWRRVECR